MRRRVVTLSAGGRSAGIQNRELYSKIRVSCDQRRVRNGGETDPRSLVASDVLLGRLSALGGVTESLRGDLKSTPTDASLVAGRNRAQRSEYNESEVFPVGRQAPGRRFCRPHSLRSDRTLRCDLRWLFFRPSIPVSLIAAPGKFYLLTP